MHRDPLANLPRANDDGGGRPQSGAPGQAAQRHHDCTPEDEAPSGDQRLAQNKRSPVGRGQERTRSQRDDAHPCDCECHIGDQIERPLGDVMVAPWTAMKEGKGDRGKKQAQPAELKRSRRGGKSRRVHTTE